MDFDENQDIDFGQIDDIRSQGSSGGSSGGFGGLRGGSMGGSRGGMGGFPIPMRGRMGVVIMIAFFLFRMYTSSKGATNTNSRGLSPASNQGAGQLNSVSAAPGSGTDLATECAAGTHWSQKQDCRVAAYVNSIQSYWTRSFADQGSNYVKANTVFFRNSVATACGDATSAVGPFYCPGDSHVYIDLDFYGELTTKFGAKGGDFAEAYVIAHEYGHHIQNLLGTNDKVQPGESGPKSGSVRLELQADCYAGVWAHNATTGASPLIKNITDDDISEGLDAASAVGDDRIQSKMAGRVTPESWTHGSSAQRQKWFRVGYDSGEPARCDTFNATDL